MKILHGEAMHGRSCAAAAAQCMSDRVYTRSLLIDSWYTSIQSIQLYTCAPRHHKMARYALRMDWNQDRDYQRISTWLALIATCYLVVFESHAGENPHVHVVFDSDKKLQALRTSFKRKFDDKVGNGSYSLKECDDDVAAYMRYMCKGNSKDDMPDVKIKQGLDFTDEKIKEAHDMYWVNNQSLKENKKKRKLVHSGETAVDTVERLCKEQGVRKNDREGIAKVYIRLCRDGRKPINQFAARAIVNTVQLLLDDTDENLDQLARSIAG